MRGLSVGLVVLAAVSAASIHGPAWAQSDEAEVVEAGAVDEAAGSPLTEDELEVLVARIALYPDELVALIIAASLYPLEIVEASRFLEQAGDDPEAQPDPDWDGSVISLLNYPEIVTMMNDDLDWTQLLGEVAINQQKDMLVAIQQLRDEAVASGVLESNEQTVVVEDNDNIVIQSPDPEVVYVPTYPPEMLYDPTYVVPPQPIVYAEPAPSYYYPSSRFWTGVVTGAVFGAIVDWDDWGTYGGDIDVDIKVDGDEIKIKGGDRTYNLQDIDRTRIERGDIDIDRNNVKQTLKKNDFNNVAVRAENKNVDRSRHNQVVKGKDVRADVVAGLQGGDGARPELKKPPAAGNRQRPDRAEARPANVQRPDGGNLKKKKPASPKPGARADKRPANPPVLGDRAKGKPAAINSDRGHRSRGGGVRGGSPHKGGAKRPGGRRR